MAEHAMPKGIKRVEKGVYRTLDDRHEIRQEEKGWEVTELASGQPLAEPFKNRGLAVQALASKGLLPTEAPKAEAKPVEEMTAKELTEVKPELHPDAEPKAEEPKRRPRTRKPRAKATV